MFTWRTRDSSFKDIQPCVFDHFTSALSSTESASIRLRHLSLVVVTSLFVAPHLHYHDLALLLLPILGFTIILVEAGVLRPEKSMYLPGHIAALLPLAISLLLLFSFASPYLIYNTANLFMLFIVLALWFPDRIFLRRQLGRKIEGPS